MFTSAALTNSKGTRCLNDVGREGFTRQFSALPSGVDALVEWLRGHEVSAAVMEGTGIYWEAPYQALEHAGIEVLLVHARHVKQLKGHKTDIADSVWLARLCQFGLCNPSMVPPARFRTLRKVSRMHCPLVRERARIRNRIHLLLDAAGIRVGGILSDLFGVNATRILEGHVAGTSREEILASLSHHVRARMQDLCDALSAPLDEPGRFVLHDPLQAFHLLFRRLFREWLTGLFRRVGAGISHIVPVLPDGSVDHGQAMA